MFTGIVESVGIIRGRKVVNGQLQLIVEGKKMRTVKKGSSVSVDGVCLTVAELSGKKMMFDVMGETVGKTTLAAKKKGDAINIEPSLRIGDEVGGHLMYGHVDGVGQVASYKLQVTEGLLTIKPPLRLMKYIVQQGSVAIDGVSLTIARVGKKDFTVALIDYTLKYTTLGKLKKGDRVNIECDMLAKYIEKILTHKS